MTARILFLGEGSSDSGLTAHVRRIATARGVEVVITDPLVERLPPPARRTVEAKLRAVNDLGGVYELIVIHRDADNAGRPARLEEINSAVDRVMTGVPCVPVIPIRMTEAWLLLDESAIRRVAGNPNSKVPLELPRAREVEKVPDPKEVLRNALAIASGVSGRKLDKLRKRFPHHRQQLIERIDPTGPIREVPSWQVFNDDLLVGLKQISE